MPKTILKYFVDCLLVLSISFGSLGSFNTISAQETEYTIQIASTPSRAEAEAIISDLKAKGVAAHLVKAAVPGKGTRYRVRIGRFNTQTEAKAMAERTRGSGLIKEYIIAQYTVPSANPQAREANSRREESVKPKQSEIAERTEGAERAERAKREGGSPVKEGPTSRNPSQADEIGRVSPPGKAAPAESAEANQRQSSPAIAPDGDKRPALSRNGGDDGSRSESSPSNGVSNGASPKTADPPTPPMPPTPSKADAAIDFMGIDNNWKVVRHSTEIDKDLRAVYFVDAMTGWAAGDAGAVYRTTDAGRTWKPLPSNVPANIYFIHFVDWNNGWMLGEVGGNGSAPEESDGQTLLLITRNGGDTWTNHPLPNVLSLYFIDRMNGWAVGKGATVLKTTDGGEQWSPVDGIEKLIGLPIESSTYNFGFRDIFFLDADHGWMIGNFYGRARSNIGGLFVTSDGGRSWKRIPLTFQTKRSSGRFTPGTLQSVRFKDLNTGSLVGEMQDGEGRFFFVLHTRDGGQTWEQFRTGSLATHSSQFPDLSNGWTAAIVPRAGGADTVTYDTTLMHTDNGGMSWQKELIAKGRRINNLFFLTPKNGWAVGDRGMILSYEERSN